MSPSPKIRAMARHSAQRLEKVPGGPHLLRYARGTRLAHALRGTPARVKADRLVESPVFIYCPVRSGSTLLRVLLNSHSQIRAPHEMHLNDVVVKPRHAYAQKGLDELGLTPEVMQNLLWDRVMHRELVLSGKQILVDKTPQNIFQWERIHRVWPKARYLYLLRNPASIVGSLTAARPDLGPERCAARVADFVEAMNQAGAVVPGLRVRYEELTRSPEVVTTQICQYLGVRWEAEMLDYGNVNHGRFKGGIGDWSAKIRSGRIQPAAPPPPLADLPPRVRELAESWGYA